MPALPFSTGANSRFGEAVPASCRRWVCLMRSLPTPAPAARKRPRLRDESGIALVLTIALGTTIYLAASAARDAHRTNGGQKAYALGEAGVNNAIAVLNTSYPGATIYPGDQNL